MIVLPLGREGPQLPSVVVRDVTIKGNGAEVDCDIQLVKGREFGSG